MSTLEITTKIGCVNMCYFCPQDKLIEAYDGPEYMDYLKYLAMLENVPSRVRIDFSGYCESWLNPMAADMMKTAITQGRSTVLYTTLVGFGEKQVEILKGLVFVEVVFHEFPGVNKVEFEQKKALFRANIDSLIFRDQVMEKKWQWSRAGNVWDMEEKKGKFHCLFAGKAFDHNVVLPNGDVYLCCQDYSLKHKIGNLLTTRFEDLDRQTIYDLSNQENSPAICRRCELAQYED